jgi:hypothetical protein
MTKEEALKYISNVTNNVGTRRVEFPYLTTLSDEIKIDKDFFFKSIVN